MNFPGEVSVEAILSRQVMGGTLPAKRFRALLKEGKVSPLSPCEGSEFGLNLLQENVLRHNMDANVGRVELTRAMMKGVELRWNHDLPAHDQPLAWLCAGLFPYGHLETIPEGLTLLQTVFPESLSARERAERWGDVMGVFRFIWEREPARLASPFKEFANVWKFSAVSEDDPSLSPSERAWLLAWEKAHGNTESQARFLAEAFHLLAIKPLASYRDSSTSFVSLLPHSRKVGALFSFPDLQHRVVGFLERSDGLCLFKKTPEMAEDLSLSLTLLWWLWAPTDALQAHPLVSIEAWKKLEQVDRRLSADAEVTAQAISNLIRSMASKSVPGLSLAHLLSKSPVQTPLAAPTLLTGFLERAPLRYHAFVRQLELDMSLPSRHSSRSTPRF